jgi:mercuric ion binding protein
MTLRTLARTLFAACALTLLPLSAATTGSTAVAQDPAPETRVVTFAISGMITRSCPVLVESAVRRIDGVEEVQASFERRNAVVRYVVGRTSPEAIARIIADRTGFRAEIER